MYKVLGKWVMVEYIFKNTTIDRNDEQWKIDASLEESDTIITKKYVPRRHIYSLEEAMPSSKDTFERDDVYLLNTLQDGNIHIILEDEDVEKFLENVGPEHKEEDGL